jgi:hypothetical protein
LVLYRAEPLATMGATLRFFPIISAVRTNWDMGRFWNQLLELLQDPDEAAEVAGLPMKQVMTTGGVVVVGAVVCV